jgi:Tfp pilus assembly pilus retraction ATPase PilT
MPYKASELELNKLLAVTLERNASDLHLQVGEPPILRIDSEPHRLDDYQILSADAVSDLIDVMIIPGAAGNFE